MEKLKDQLQLHQFLQVCYIYNLIIFKLFPSDVILMIVVFYIRIVKNLANGFKRRNLFLKTNLIDQQKQFIQNGLGIKHSKLKSLLTKIDLSVYKR